MKPLTLRASSLPRRAFHPLTLRQDSLPGRTATTQIAGVSPINDSHPGRTAATGRGQGPPGKDGHHAEVRGPLGGGHHRGRTAAVGRGQGSPQEGQLPQTEIRVPLGRTATAGRGQGSPWGQQSPRKDGRRGQRSRSPRGRVCTTGPTPRFHTSRGGIRRGPHRCNVLYRNIPLEQNTFSFQAPPLLPRLRGATSENTGHQ